MATKTASETQLAVVVGFGSPKVSLKQYPTPSDLATHFVRLADLCGDIEGVMVLDLGSGTGVLELGAVLHSPTRVIGVEFDGDALATATDSARRVGVSAPIDWIRVDATRLPPCLPDDRQVMVFMNPLFGVQRGNEHADHALLDPTASVADVPYSVHNERSKEFVESFVVDVGGDLTDAFRMTFDLDHQFDFHDEDCRRLDAEMFRTEW